MDEFILCFRIGDQVVNLNFFCRLVFVWFVVFNIGFDVSCFIVVVRTYLNACVCYCISFRSQGVIRFQDVDCMFLVN